MKFILEARIPYSLQRVGLEHVQSGDVGIEQQQPLLQIRIAFKNICHAGEVQ